MHISLSEIVVILLVALLVIKPERLPEVAAVLGKWVRGIRRMVAQIKNEVDLPLGKYSYRDEKSEN